MVHVCLDLVLTSDDAAGSMTMTSATVADDAERTPRHCVSAAGAAGRWHR